MREIKFRMWNQYSEDEGIYIYSPDEVYECIKQQVNYSNGEVIGHDHNGDGSVFEQYTGLKDKNGKEIYEGDVVIIPDYSMGAFFGISQPTKTITVGYGKIFNGYGYYGLHYKDFELEIIGNIHENPELLKP